MNQSALVIIPTYNERANIPVLIAGLMQHAGVRVLVVDDNSPDGTGAVAEELGRQHQGRVSVLHRTANRGFGRSYIDGMVAAGEVDTNFAVGLFDFPMLNSLRHYFVPSLAPATFNVAAIVCAFALTPLMPPFGYPRIMMITPRMTF